MPDTDPDLDPLCDGDPLARALAKLRPAPAALDAGRLAYLAGQASQAAKIGYLKRIVLAQCAAMVAVGCLAVVHFARLKELKELEGQTAPPTARAVKPIEPPPDVPEPAPLPRIAPDQYRPDPGYPSELLSREANTREMAEYFRVRQEVLAAGLGLLPEEKKSVARGPVNAAELEESLQLPPGVLTAPFYAAPKPKPPESEQE